MRIVASLSVVVLTLLTLTTASAQSATPVEPDASSRVGDFLLFRVYYDKISDLTPISNLDIWENNLQHKYILVAGDQATVMALRSAGWRVAVDSLKTAQVLATDTTALFSGGYRTVDEIYDAMDALAAANPSLTELHSYGQSYCKLQSGCLTPGGEALAGYDLRAIRITNEATAGTSTITNGTVTRGTKPILYVEAAIHSREITTPEIAMRLANWFLSNYGTDAAATWLVDWHEVWIVPIVNPDGHWLVSLGTLPKYGGSPFYHRKNANNDANNNGIADCSQWTPLSNRHFGVDLNRNHNFSWGPPGSSNLACDQTYRGPAAASEPETSSREALIRRLFADQRGPNLNDAAPDTATGMLITLHSYGDLVLFPWGFDTPNLPPDYAPNRAGLKAISDRLATFSGAQSCQPLECMYGANGATDDWAYGELGIPGLTYEIGNDFMPAYSVIDSVQWPAYGPSLIHAAKLVREPYKLALGPEVIDVSINLTADSATLTATVSDGKNGNQTVQEAEYSIGLPFWAAGADPQPLAAADGAFDETAEVISASFSTAGLGDGPHIVYLRGRDAQRNWGVVTAAYLVNIVPAAPTVTGFSPSSGLVGTTITINGTNLSGATAVSIGGVAAANFSPISATQLKAVVAAGTSSGEVSVTTPGGTGTSSSAFTVLSLGTISSINPTSGRAGRIVIINGTGLGGATAVSFNGAAATGVKAISATRVRATVPLGATTGTVRVITPAGTVDSPTSFVVLPTVSGFGPAAAAAGASVLITGSGFSDVRAVSFYKTPASYTVLSSTQIRAIVPAGAARGPITVETAAGKATSKARFRVLAQ